VPLKVASTDPNNPLFQDGFKNSPLEYVRTLFVGFFQGLFNAADRGAYHWEANDELSEIYISDENSLKAETIGQRPAITCTRGPVQFYTLGLGDMAGYDPRTGTTTKSVLVPGTMTVNCSSRVSLECDRIAWICAEQLWMNREVLLKAGFFEVGRIPVIGSPSPAGSIIQSDIGDEWYVVSVTCPFQFQRTSQTSPLGTQIIRELVARLHTRLPLLAQQDDTIGHGGQPSSPVPGLPYEITRHYPPAYAPQASDVYGNTPVAGQKAPVLQTVPHPLNPAQRVTVRAARPNAPAVQPACMGGRPIPLAATSVEESSSQLDAHGAGTTTVKV
jgi:hypothetical protein